MEKLDSKSFTGERALYGIKDKIIENSVFEDGESPLKEVENIKINKCSFKWKYPLWYAKKIEVNDCNFEIMSRSGIWYSEDLIFKNCKSVTPKSFRRCKRLKIFDSEFKDCTESMWECEYIEIKNSKFSGDYLLKNAENVVIDGLTLDGNYLLDGGKHIIVRNSILNSRDAFWNCDDVLVENCIINSEYIAWNTKNIKFVNCQIDSIQPFCYTQNLKLVDCKMFHANLSFERSTVKGNILNRIESIKNPYELQLKIKGYDELIVEENISNKDNIHIEVEEE